METTTEDYRKHRTIKRSKRDHLTFFIDPSISQQIIKRKQGSTSKTISALYFPIFRRIPSKQLTTNKDLEALQHRIKERRRHKDINLLIDSLTDRIPIEYKDSKDTKVTLLQRTVAYFCFIEKKIEHISTQLGRESPDLLSNLSGEIPNADGLCTVIQNLDAENFQPVETVNAYMEAMIKNPGLIDKDSYNDTNPWDTKLSFTPFLEGSGLTALEQVKTGLTGDMVFDFDKEVSMEVEECFESHGKEKQHRVTGYNRGQYGAHNGASDQQLLEHLYCDEALSDDALDIDRGSIYSASINYSTEAMGRSAGTKSGNIEGFDGSFSTKWYESNTDLSAFIEE